MPIAKILAAVCECDREDDLGWIYCLSRITTKTLAVSRPRDSGLEFSNRSEIWQAHWQQCCWDACLISERFDHCNIQYHCFETLQDLAVRRLTAWWIEAQCWTVLEIPRGPPVQGQQLCRRTRNFLLIFLQFYVYNLRFKAWGPTTFSTEFQTLVLNYHQWSPMTLLKNTSSTLPIFTFAPWE